MPSIDVTISDATGSRQQQASLPDDAALQRIVAKLIDVLKLPLSAPDGQPMSYKFHHVQSARQLRDDMTLIDAGVQAGDTLRLVPEIVAG
jgi:hypothetical protein